MTKRILSLMLALALCLSLAACGKDKDDANGGTAGNGTDDAAVFVYDVERSDTDTLTWDFNADNGTLSIHGEGLMRSYFDVRPEWEQYRDSILVITLDDGITSVGEYAFENYRSVTEVRLPDSIEIIDDGAFDYDTELRKITLPASLKYVGYRAFYNTLLWEPADLVFPEGCEFIGDYAFHSALKSGGVVSLPASLKYLGMQSFTNAYLSDFIISEDNETYCISDHAVYTKDMKKLLMLAPYTERASEFRIPDGVERIGSECFNLMQGVETVYIPASVTDIAEGAFFSTFELKSIVVDENNPNYKSENSLLLSKDGRLLLAWPDGIECTELVIPSGVERIGEYLFYGRFDSSYNVVIPEGVKEIGSMSLPDSMASLTLPASLEEIGDYVFYDGITIGSITYNGTAADWEKITIADGNDGLDASSVKMN